MAYYHWTDSTLLKTLNCHLFSLLTNSAHGNTIFVTKCAVWYMARLVRILKMILNIRHLFLVSTWPRGNKTCHLNSNIITKIEQQRLLPMVQYRNLIPAPVDQTSVSAWWYMYKHPVPMGNVERYIEGVDTITIKSIGTITGSAINAIYRRVNWERTRIGYLSKSCWWLEPHGIDKPTLYAICILYLTFLFRRQRSCILPAHKLGFVILLTLFLFSLSHMPVLCMWPVYNVFVIVLQIVLCIDHIITTLCNVFVIIIYSYYSFLHPFYIW